MVPLSLARRGVAAIPARPAVLLTALALLAWALALWLALDTPHNGWVWYSGGDATEYWTGEWAIGHGILPQAVISYGLPVLYAWVPLVSGMSLLDGLPVIAVLQAVVLVPLALALVWAVGDRLFGQRFAAAAAGLWVAGPLLMLWAFHPGYRSEFEQLVLAPHWAGLTNMADLLSLVAVLATAWSALRAVDSGRAADGAIAGFLAGVAIGIKPANAYIVPALVVLFAGTRRPRTAAAWVAGVVPALVTLAVWKARGLGHLPITSSYSPLREASSPTLALTGTRYVAFDRHHLGSELAELDQVFWSVRALEFLIVAGALGALRRLPVKGLFVIVWFAAFFVVKGSAAVADISTTSYWRLVEPGWPAFVYLVVATAFLWPGVRRLRSTPPHETFVLRPHRRSLGVCAVLAIIPLVLVAAVRPTSPPRIARDNLTATDTPISQSLTPRWTASAAGTTISWSPPRFPGSTRVSYAVFRARGNDGCFPPPGGAPDCYLVMKRIASVQTASYTDQPPAAGSFTYRVAVVADYRGNPLSSDLMLLSGAATTLSP